VNSLKSDPVEPELSQLLDLPASTLLELGNALQGGALRFGVSTSSLHPFLGSRSAQLTAVIRAMLESGCTTETFGRWCHVLHEAKCRMETSEASIFLALSGPEVPGTPVVSTPTMVRALFEEAKRDVIVTSYVFSHCRELLAPLADKLDHHSDFKVRFIVDLSHQRKVPAEQLPIVANRFKANFLANYWSGSREPEFWHDPRVFTEKDNSLSGVMHAKAVIIDREVALVTSANFTEAAQNRNMEAGVIVRQSNQVVRLRNYFEGLIETGMLKQI
jgi:phosphatidylserine/phosphatidylglycerophosphate/cardiolipin synthase-like enzyme